MSPLTAFAVGLAVGVLLVSVVVATRLDIFERIVRAIPRYKLDDLCREYGNEKPWQSSRRELENFIISKDSGELREELCDYIRTALTASI